MKQSNFSRRDFIKSIGIAGGLSLMGSSIEAQDRQSFIISKGCKVANGFIRKNFKNLTAAELAAFKNGVAVMKARPVSDPTSWAYQAAIHGTEMTPVQMAWNTCQHDITHFMSWHRMYVCFFEKILRKASGSATLALPYWNYSNAADTNARFLPAAFRIPANSSNPLYVSDRNPSFNAGTGQLSTSAVSLSSVIPGSTGFYPFSGSINGTPHGVVHVSIGGWMSAFETAGQDPIFWLHHCNIDRLWNRWLAQGGGRANPPTSDTAWHNTSFTFFNENGQAVQMTGADLVNPLVNTCRYCYDEEIVVIGIPFLSPLLTARRIYSEILIGVLQQPLVLEAQPLRFELALNDKARESFARVAASMPPEEQPNLKLNFEGARADKAVEFFYEVYLNLPESVQDPDNKMENYAGNLSFFGADRTHSHHGNAEEPKFGVYVTDAVKRLGNLGAEGKLSVTLIPTGLVSTDERRMPIRSDAKVSVERVSLTFVESQR